MEEQRDRRSEMLNMQEQLAKAKAELLAATTASAKAQDQAQRLKESLTTQLEDAERSLQSLQESSARASVEQKEKVGGLLYNLSPGDRLYKPP